ncbi:MAG: choice-of-anchor D domain-containing protein [Candidatus Riflebacteria bacterium]|nr:choice-of-anchor D domain-containing protein [Candidatus Riflebacteria bacterium]
MKKHLFWIILLFLPIFLFVIGGCGRVGGNPGSEVSNELLGSFKLKGAIQLDQSNFSSSTSIKASTFLNWKITLFGDNNFQKSVIPKDDGSFSFEAIPVLSNPYLEAVSTEQKIRLFYYFENGKIVSSWESIIIDEASTVLFQIFYLSRSENSNVTFGSILNLKATNNPSFLAAEVSLKKQLSNGGNLDILATSTEEIERALQEASQKEPLPAEIIIIPNPLDFGNASDGISSVPAYLTFKNLSSGEIVVSSFTVSGPFAISGVFFPFTLKSQEAKIIPISYYPLGSGINNGKLEVFHNGKKKSETVYLIGSSNPIKREVTIDPPFLQFENQSIGASGTPKILKIKNLGNVNQNIQVSLDSSDFFITKGPASFSLKSGEEMLFEIVLNPKESGSINSAVFFDCQDPNGVGIKLSVNLLGSGEDVFPQCQINPEFVEFSDTGVGSQSEWKSIEITNTGNKIFSIDSITIDGPFEITDLVIPFFLKPGVSQKFRCRFSPIREGKFQSQIKVKMDLNSAPKIISLAGTGILYSSNLLIEPSEINFGYIGVGSISLPTLFSLKNQGNQTLKISNNASSGDFIVQNLSSAIKLSPGDKWEMKAAFKPNSIGSQSGNIWFFSDDFRESKKITFSGNGTFVAPKPVFDPISIDFGTITIGSESQSFPIFFRNDGNENLNVSDITTDGPFYCPDVTRSFVLFPGDKKVINCRFKPIESGQKKGSLNVFHSGPTGSSTADLLGTGKLANIFMDVTPTQIDFGVVEVGSESKNQAISIRNSGLENLIIYSVDSQSQFTFSKPAFPLSLGKDESFQLNCRYSPRIVGPETGEIDIYSNSGSGAVMIKVQGEGTKPTVKISLQPGTFDFGNIEVGTVSQQQTFIISNDGLITANISSVSTEGSFEAEGLNFPLIINAGNQVTFTGIFKPTIEGLNTGKFSIGYGNPISTSSINLQGTGIFIPKIAVSTNSISFSDTLLGSQSEKIPITVRNFGSGILKINGISPPLNFQIETPSIIFPKSLNSGESFTFNAYFRPTTLGIFSAYVDMTSNATNPLILLKGKGIGARLEINPPSLVFQKTLLNQSSVSALVELDNTGNIPLTISSYTIDPNFQISGTFPSQIPAGGNAQINVLFAPKTTGDLSGNLNIISNSLTGLGSINLAGQAYDIGGKVSFSANPLNFTTKSNIRSDAQTLTLTNIGTQTLLINNIQVSLPDFEITPIGSFSLDSSQQQNFSVTFFPKQVGSETGEISFFNSSDISEVKVNLLGSSLASATNLVKFGQEISNITGLYIRALFSNYPTNFDFSKHTFYLPVLDPFSNTTKYILYEWMDEISGFVTNDLGQGGLPIQTISSITFNLPVPVDSKMIIQDYESYDTKTDVLNVTVKAE